MLEKYSHQQRRADRNLEGSDTTLVRERIKGRMVPICREAGRCCKSSHSSRISRSQKRAQGIRFVFRMSETPVQVSVVNNKFGLVSANPLVIVVLLQICEPRGRNEHIMLTHDKNGNQGLSKGNHVGVGGWCCFSLKPSQKGAPIKR